MFSSSAIAGTPIINAVARTWWLWLIRGLAAIIFGLLAFTWPGLTWITIAILFGAYALVDGIFAIVAAVRAVEHQQRWWPFLLEGLVGILIAAITWYDIRITIAALYLTIAAWAFITGILELVAAVQLRKHISNEIWLIIGGIASIAFGVLMLLFPLIGAITVIYIIAAYAIVFGIIMIGFAFRLRSHMPGQGTS
ncbi:MAG: HdeD family acid-resistance protein [Candidatus Cybelea sp.]